MNSEGIRNLSFASHPAASGRDPGVMVVTEEWGDQPSSKAAADLGTLISIACSGTVSSHDVNCCFLPGP